MRNRKHKLAKPTLPPVTAEEFQKEYGSIEAAMEIRKAVEELKSAPHFGAIMHKLMGDYWSPAWPTAPFEQELTLKQVTELEPEKILKKRSFHGKKVTAFILALRKASTQPVLRDVKQGLVDRGVAQTPHSDTSRTVFLQTSADAFEVWTKEEITSLPSELQVGLAFIAQECVRAKQFSSPLARLLSELPETLRPVELAVIWRLADNAEEEAYKSLRFWGNLDKKDSLKASKKLEELARKHLPAVVNSWDGLLRNVGILERSLSEPYFEPSFNFIAQAALFRALLYSIGARHPQVGDRVFLTHWTMEPRALADALNTLRKNSINLEYDLSLLFPFFETQDLLQALKSIKEKNPVKKKK